MPQRSSKPYYAAHLAANRTALRALKLLENYTPQNSAYTKDALLAIDSELSQVEEREFALEMSLNATRAARDELAAKLHEGMLGAKAAVLSQYGPDSDELESLGLKKKSEYRRTARRASKSSV